MNVSIKILFFAKARELTGRSIDNLIVPNSISCADLQKIIVDTYNLSEIKSNFILSVNEEFKELGDILTLEAGDEVAVIPPLSGG